VECAKRGMGVVVAYNNNPEKAEAVVKPSPGWVERRYRVFRLEDTAVISSSLG
jgi:hypothetical protein